MGQVENATEKKTGGSMDLFYEALNETGFYSEPLEVRLRELEWPDDEYREFNPTINVKRLFEKDVDIDLEI